jgi:feruloyl esterase
LNAESFANFGRLQIKKTHDVAMALVQKRYGTSPRHSYFIGGSQGGHEALIAALFYPADYDGIVAHYPAYDITLMHLAAQYRARALFPQSRHMDQSRQDESDHDSRVRRV